MRAKPKTIERPIEPADLPVERPARAPYLTASVIYIPSANVRKSGGAEDIPGQPLAAIVVDVNSRDVNLQVFGTFQVFPRHNVAYSSEPRANTWHWPGEVLFEAGRERT